MPADDYHQKSLLRESLGMLMILKIDLFFPQYDYRNKKLAVFIQITEAEKRLGRVAILKEESQRDSTNEESEGQQEEEGEMNDGEQDIGIQSKVSLLDQHSELKKKAEGIHSLIDWFKNKTAFYMNHMKIVNVP